MVAQSQGLGDHAAGLGMVAREQDDVAHLARPQRLHRLRRVVAQLVLQDQHRGQPSVDGREERRGADGVRGGLVGGGRAEHDLVRLHQASAADQDVSVVDANLHAEAHPLGRGGDLGNLDPALGRQPGDGTGHRMAERSFGRRHQAHDLVFRERPVPCDTGHARRADPASYGCENSLMAPALKACRALRRCRGE